MSYWLWSQHYSEVLPTDWLYSLHPLKSEASSLKMNNSRERAERETQHWYRELPIDTEGSFCERSPKSESEDVSSEESKEDNSEPIIIRDSERDQDEEQATAE